MKRQYSYETTIVFTCLLVATAFVQASSANEKAKTVTLRSDVWCPYICEDPKAPGFYVEYAKEVLSMAGYTLDFQVLNWSRSIEDTRAGKYDGILGASKADAPDFLFPTEWPIQMQSCFYTTKSDKWTFTDSNSLKNKKLGIAKDYTYGAIADEYIRSNIKNKNLIETASGENASVVNFKKLTQKPKKRIDILIDDHNVFSYTVNQHKLEASAVKKSGCIDPIELNIGISPKSKIKDDLLKVFTNGLKTMKSNGRLEELKKKYSLQN